MCDPGTTIVAPFFSFISSKTKSNKIEKYKPSNKEKKNYEDFIIEDNENFIVINKPSGIPVQSGTKSFKNIIDILRAVSYTHLTLPTICSV